MTTGPKNDQRLAQLADTAERHQVNIERLTQSIERQALIFGEQARVISELSRTASQAIEAVLLMAQNNRDLIQELKRDRAAQTPLIS